MSEIEYFCLGGRAIHKQLNDSHKIPFHILDNKFMENMDYLAEEIVDHSSKGMAFLNRMERERESVCKRERVRIFDEDEQGKLCAVKSLVEWI